MDELIEIVRRVTAVEAALRRAAHREPYLTGTLATLSALDNVGDGTLAWCTDARKSGEGAGAGTGCWVYYTDAAAYSANPWRNLRDDAAAAT